MVDAELQADVTDIQDHEGFLKGLLHDPVGVAGAIMIGLILLAAVLGPLVAPHDPTMIYVDARLAAPGGRFLLGADELGRDVLSRVLYGARISVQVGVTVVAFAGVIGVTIGLLAGFYRGWLDGILMRIMDSIFAFPTLLLALAVIAVLGTELRNLIAALVVVYVPAFARIARSATLTVMQEPYLEAARSLGARTRRLLIKHILPNIAAPVTVQFTIGLAYAILVEASLSYLGLGVQPPAASWGSMLATGKPYIEFAPWVSLVPGFCIMFTVLGFNLLGDAMRDTLDPRLRTVQDG
ncbi:MAG TPA: ABC transporter permease [Acidimicrobiia bacterium]